LVQNLVKVSLQKKKPGEGPLASDQQILLTGSSIGRPQKQQQKIPKRVVLHQKSNLENGYTVTLKIGKAQHAGQVKKW